METNKTGCILKVKVVMKVLPSYFCILTIQLIKEVEKILDVAFVVFPRCSAACLLPFYQLVLQSLRRLYRKFSKQTYNDLSVEGGSLWSTQSERRYRSLVMTGRETCFPVGSYLIFTSVIQQAFGCMATHPFLHLSMRIVFQVFIISVRRVWNIQVLRDCPYCATVNKHEDKIRAWSYDASPKAWNCSSKYRHFLWKVSLCGITEQFCHL